MATLKVVAAGGVLTAAATYIDCDTGAAPAGAPTAADDIVLDSASGNVSLTATNLNAHSIDFTGTLGLGKAFPPNGSAYSGTFSCSTTRTMTIGGAATNTAAAVFKLSASMTWTNTGTITLALDNRSGGLTITSNGKAFNVQTINVGVTTTAGATATFADTFSASSCTVFAMRRMSLTVSPGATLALPSAQLSWGATTGSATLTWSGATLQVGSFTNSTSGQAVVLVDSSTSVLALHAQSNLFPGDGVTDVTFLGEVRHEQLGTFTISAGNHSFGKWTAQPNSRMQLPVGHTQTILHADGLNWVGTSGGLVTVAPSADSALPTYISCAQQLVGADWLFFAIAGPTNRNTVNGTGAGAPHRAGANSSYIDKPSGWLFGAAGAPTFFLV